MVRAINSNVIGDWSLTSQFTTYNNAPTVQTNKPKSTDQIDPKKTIIFEYNATDKDADELMNRIHLWSTTSDTTITNIKGQSYPLPADKLKSNITYSYNITTSDGTKETTSQTETFRTKIDPALEGKVTLYPNPASGEFLYIVHTTDFPKTIYREIMDFWGRVLYNNKTIINFGETVEQIPVGKLKKGIYLIQETSLSTGEKQRMRFIKE
jgi:hypothetical protein